MKKTKKYRELEQKYRIENTGLNVVLEELKQRLQANAMKIKRYNQRIEQYKINKLFQQDQKQVYQQLNGKTNNNEKPDADESKRLGVTSGIAKVSIRRKLNG